MKVIGLQNRLERYIKSLEKDIEVISNRKHSVESIESDIRLIQDIIDDLHGVMQE